MTETLRIPIAITDEYSGQLKAFQEAIRNVKQPDSVKHLNQSFDKMQTGARKAKEIIGDGLRSALQGFGIGALSVSAGITAIAASSLSLSNSIVGLKRVSDETGVSINKLNTLTKAAERFGVSSSTVAPSIKKLSENLRDLKYGFGSLPSLNNVKGGPELLAKLRKAKSTDEATQIALDAIAKTKDPISRNRLSSALFGTEEMAKFGLLGKAAMDQKIEGTRKNVRDIKPEDIENAESLEKAITSVKESFVSLKDGLGSALMPTVAELSEKMKNFINDNRDFLEGKFKEAVETVTKWVKSLNWDDISAKIKRFGEVVAGVAGFLGGLIPEKSAYTKALEKVPRDIKEKIEKQYPGGNWELDPIRKESRYRYKNKEAHWYDPTQTLYPSEYEANNPSEKNDSQSYDKNTTINKTKYRESSENQLPDAYGNSGLLHKSSYTSGADFVGVPTAGTSESAAQRIIRQGVFEALLMFKQWLEGAVSSDAAVSLGGNGGGGGFQKASYAPPSYGVGNDAAVTGKITARGSLVKNQKEAYGALREEGISSADAKTLVGNLSGEGLANPSDYHWDRKHMSQGIVQWDPARSARIRQQFGKEPRFMSVAEQTKAMLWEMKNHYPKTWAALQNTNLTHQKKMAIIVKDYERPAHAETAIKQRMQHRNGLNLDADAAVKLSKDEAKRQAEKAVEKNRENQEAIIKSAPAKTVSPTSGNLINASFGGSGIKEHGSLDICLHGFPKGTSTKSDMKNLFRDVEITKARPMVPASMEI